MKCYENKELVTEIIRRLSVKERRKGQYMVTRLVCCPRKTFYKFTGVPEIRTDEFELILARGKGHHGALEVFETREIELKKVADCGITVYGDVDMKDDRFIEVFTTNVSSNKVPEGDAEAAAEVFPIKFRQLGTYCNMGEQKAGDLLIFFLMGNYSRFTEILGRKVYTGIKPNLRAFTYNFEEVQLSSFWRRVNINLEEIELGRKTGIPPACCGEKFECNYCGYAYTCLGQEVIAEIKDEIPFTEADLK